MKIRITPHFVSLAYDACLKSFWRKNALAKFLRLCDIPETYLASWLPEESKRDLLDRVFSALPRTNEGHSVIVRIAQSLIEQRSFPDLEHWEDSSQKIKEAHDAVSRLRVYYHKQDEQLQSERERQKAREILRKKQTEIARSQESLQKLSDRLAELSKQLGTQKAGYDFQCWFYDLVDFFEIRNRRPYVHNGRQIDGSITIAGTTYLVELKFSQSQAPVTDIDSFYKKVVSGADNTMGIMVSISGYTGNSLEGASGARTPLLLMDHAHLYLALSGIMNLADIVDRIRRHASQTGEAYLKADKFSA